MKSSTILASLAAVASASPLVRRAAVTDAQILNFALTLEHLEAAFYHQALHKYSDQDFINAGLTNWAHGRFTQIAAHEHSHVDFLSHALGNAATKACTYNFPDNDLTSFIKLANLLENVGTSAYLGAAKYIQNKDYLEAAATILTVEARHASWIASSVRKGEPWNTPFDTPLDLNQVFTLASPLFESCPGDNPKLPVKAFPALAIDTFAPNANIISFSYSSSSDKPPFALFLSGTNLMSSPIRKNGDKWEADIPKDLLGYSYLIISSNPDSAADEYTIAGPAVLEFRFDSAGRYFQ